MTTNSPASEAEERIYKKKVIASYAVDIICLIVFGAAAGVIEFIPPRQIDPSRIDPNSINLPLVPKVWVPNYILPLFSMGLPLLIIVIFMAAKRFKQKRLSVAIIGLFLSVFMSFLFTNVLKNTIGRLRPDFLNEDHKNWNEGRRSFPSGHASSSFAGLAFASLFMSGQLKLFDGGAHIERLLACLSPSILAWLIALSRIVDHRHNWDDVLVGSMIGIACAFFSYFFYFPSPWSAQCNEPLDVRFVKLRGEAAQEANALAEGHEIISKENIV